MEITFEKLKSDLDAIVQEFRRTLNNGDYTTAKTMAKTVLDLYKNTYGIELDTNPEFNHIFHEVMRKMDNEIIANNAEPSKTVERQDLIKTFAKVADEVFRVADVRKKAMEMDPTGKDLIAAYQKGIDEANAHKDKLLDMQKEYNKIKNDIYGKDSPSLKEKIEDEKFYIGRLDIIRTKIQELDVLQKSIDLMEADIARNSTLESRLRGNIDANKMNISNGLLTIQSMLDEMKRKGVNIDSIKDAVSLNTAQRMSTLARIDYMRNGFNNDLTNHYQQLINNIKNAKRKNPQMSQLKNINFSKMDPSTEEGRKAIEDELKPFLEYEKHIDDAIELQERHIAVFEQSIKQVEEEIKIIETDISDTQRYTDGMTDDVKARIRAEEDYYKQDIYDKMYGNPEKAEKWKKYLKLLKASEKECEFELRNFAGNPIMDENGLPKKGKYRTVDYADFEQKLSRLHPPVSREEALKLLQLEEYQTRLERITKMKAGDKFSLTEFPSYSEYMRSTTADERKAAMQRLKKEFDEDLIYVKTNHQVANTHEYLANAIGNAGALVKYHNGIEKVSGKGFIGGVKAIGHNARSLLGLRSVSDAKTLLGKAVTVALDAGMIVIAPLSLPTKLIYRYTPIVGKEAQKRRYEKKYEGEYSSPYDGRKDARKMQRREEYKARMKGPFKGARAWIKATNDNWLYRERAEETEQACMDRHFKENVQPSIHNRYINGARRADIEKKQKAQENLEIRRDAAREISRRDYTQSDLAVEPRKAENITLNPRAMQGGVLELNGLDSENIRYSDTTRPRRTQFTTIRRALGALHGDLQADRIDYSRTEGSVVQTDAIDMATRQKGVESTTTARNYVPYLLTGVAVGAAARYGISKIGKTTDKVIEGGTEKKWEITRYEEYDRIVQQQQYKEVPDTSTVARTPAEFAQANNGLTEDVHISVWGGENKGFTGDISANDSSVGFYAKIPNTDGTFEEIAFAIPEGNGQYDYLGQLVNKYNLPQTTVSKYMDMTTGTFKPDADLYNMAADIANHTGATTGLTGDKLVEMVFNGEAQTYVEMVKTPGAKDGGWISTIFGQQLGTKRVPDGFVDVVIKAKRPVWELVEKQLPDTIVLGSDGAKEIADAIGGAFVAGHIIEATEKATRPIKSTEPDYLDTPDKVEPGRRKNNDDWTL